MLNFRRKGTLASAAVSQMTIPSRYRSVLAGGGAATDCATSGVAKHAVEASVTAATAVVNARGIDTLDLPARAVRNDRSAGMATLARPRNGPRSGEPSPMKDGRS